MIFPRREVRRPGAARRLVTFLARPRKVTKGRPPRGRAPYSHGYPVLPASQWRLPNSPRRGTHNVPHCGTRTVLVDYPKSSRAARRATRGIEKAKSKNQKSKIKNQKSKIKNQTLHPPT